MDSVDVVSCSQIRAWDQGCIERDLLKVDEIDDMLLCLYYIYERSPKKCRELNDTVIDFSNS